MSPSIGERIDTANAEVVRRLTEPNIRWVGCAKASDVVPGMRSNLIMHSGPPIEWSNMCPLQREAVVGAVLFEGLAETRDGAVAALDAGEVDVEPCHAHSSVGAMAGPTSASMGMLVVENAEFGTRAFCKIVERQLQFGQHSPEIFDNLRWLADDLGPALDAALQALGGLALMPLIGKALHMGDECHNRNVAATALIEQAIAPALAEVAPAAELPRMLRYFQQIDQAFLGLAMATGKALTEPATGVEHSTVVTTMARNGVEFGIKVSGLGDRWFTGPAQRIQGAFLPGYDDGQATNDIGDSTITETIGLGGMVAASALTAGAIGGASAQDTIARTRDNREIAAGASRAFTIPVLDFEGAGVGIDIRKVVKLGTLPMLLTGIGANVSPWGRIGAGQVFPPMAPFVEALKAVHATAV